MNTVPKYMSTAVTVIQCATIVALIAIFAPLFMYCTEGRIKRPCTQNPVCFQRGRRGFSMF